MGTDTICRGDILGTNTIYRGYILGTNTKCRHQKKNFETFEMSGFARPTFVKGGKFPLCS